MRRLIPILLITAVLIEIAGFYGMYVIKQFFIKEAAEETMHSKEGIAAELRFAFKLKNNQPEEASFRWTDNDEFTYEGMMFDVSQKEIKGDSVILHCINDTDELSLIEQFKNLFNSKPDNKSSENNSIFLQFLSNLFIPAEKTEIAFIPGQPVLRSSKNDGAIRHMSYEILKPPPQVS